MLETSESVSTFKNFQRSATSTFGGSFRTTASFSATTTTFASPPRRDSGNSAGVTRDASPLRERAHSEAWRRRSVRIPREGAFLRFSNYCDSDHYHEDSLCDRSCERNRHNVTPALAPHHFPAMGCAVGAPEPGTLPCDLRGEPRKSIGNDSSDSSGFFVRQVDSETLRTATPGIFHGGSGMTETFSFDEEIQEALSGSSPRSSMCSQESEEAPSPHQVCFSPNRLMHDMHVQDLQDLSG
eukprot:s1952_g1.t1